MTSIRVGNVGPKGDSAFTVVTTNFIQPAINGTVSISVLFTTWMSVGLSIFIEGGGCYSIVSITDILTVVIKNLGYSDNSSSGTTIVSGARIVSNGIKGTSALPEAAVILPNTNYTVNIASGKRYRILSGTLTANHTATINNTGATNGDIIDFIREDYSTFIYSINLSDGYAPVYLGPAQSIQFQRENSYWKVNTSGRKPSLDPTVSVIDFGADPTGVNDSTAAFQTMFNSIPGLSSTVIEIPDGVYKITKTLTIINNNFARTMKVRGFKWSSGGQYGTMIKYAGTPANLTAFLTSKATTTSSHVYSGTGLDGSVSNTLFTEPRRIIVSLSGIKASFVQSSFITIAGIDMWGLSVTEQLSISFIGGLSGLPDPILPFSISSGRYFTQVNSITVDAQAGIDGYISVGTSDATMILSSGNSSFEMEDITLDCNSTAGRGIHIVYNEKDNVGCTNTMITRVAILRMNNHIGNAGIAYGDMTGAMVSELVFRDVQIGGSWTPGYLPDGILCVRGNNAGNVTIERPMISGLRIGINLYWENAFYVAIKDCIMSGTWMWCFAFGNCMTTLTGGYSEQGGGFWARHSNSSQALSVSGFVWNGIVLDSKVIQCNGINEMSYCSLVCSDGSTDIGCKVCIAGVNPFISKHNSYTTFNDDSNNYPPIWDYPGSSQLFSRTSTANFASGSFSHAEVTSQSDFSINYPKTWDTVSIFPSRVAVGQLQPTGGPLWGTTRPPAISRFCIPFQFDWNYAKTWVGGYATISNHVIIPVGFRLVGIYAYTTTAWTHPTAATITLSVGGSNTATDFTNLLLEHSVKTIVTKGTLDSDLGTGLNRAGAVQGSFVPANGPTSFWYISFKMIMSGGTFDGVTAGLTKFQFFIEGTGNIAEI